MKINILLLISIIILGSIYCDSVCSAQQLIDELRQDIMDNNKLDCLRKPLPAPKDRQESTEEKKARIDAAWDSDCAFEADYDWLSPLRERYGLRSGLVDKDGKAIDFPFDTQADMCELVRAMIAGNLFEGQKIDTLSEDSFEGLECVGPKEKELQICAATGGSAGQNYSWTILLDPSSFTVKDSTERPKFKLDTQSKEKIEQRKGN